MFTNTVEAIIKWNVDESAGSKKFLHPGYSISIGFLEYFILRIRYKSSVRDMDRWTEQISTTFSPKKPCFKSTRGISETCIPIPFEKSLTFHKIHPRYPFTFIYSNFYIMIPSSVHREMTFEYWSTIVVKIIKGTTIAINYMYKDIFHNIIIWYMKDTMNE